MHRQGTSKEALAAGASDVTRGVDALVASDRLAMLSDVVAAAGVTDVAQSREELVEAAHELSEASSHQHAGSRCW